MHLAHDLPIVAFGLRQPSVREANDGDKNGDESHEIESDPKKQLKQIQAEVFGHVFQFVAFLPLLFYRFFFGKISKQKHQK